MCHIQKEIQLLRRIAAYQLIDHRSIRWNNYRLMNYSIICIPTVFSTLILQFNLPLGSLMSCVQGWCNHHQSGKESWRANRKWINIKGVVMFQFSVELDNQVNFRKCGKEGENNATWAASQCSWPEALLQGFVIQYVNMHILIRLQP